MSVLKVRLDHCEERDGLVWFDASPLTGVGAEVDDAVLWREQPAGRVKLWYYEEGERIGPWEPSTLSEPDPAAAEQFYVAFRGTVGVCDFIEYRTIFEDQPLTGWAVRFSDAYLTQMGSFIDGFDGAETRRWHLDGSLRFVSYIQYFRTGESGFAATQHHEWPPGVATEPDDQRPCNSKLRLSQGEWGSPGDYLSLGDNYGGYPIVTLPFGYTGPYSSSLEIDFDTERQITRLFVRRHGQFDVLQENNYTVEPLAGMPLSWDAVAKLDAAPELELTVSGLNFDGTIAGLGGMEWFNAVTDLHFNSYDLDPNKLALFLELPNLQRFHFAHIGPWTAEAHKEIAELCRDALQSRPHLHIELPEAD